MAEIRDWYSGASPGRTGTNLFAPAPVQDTPATNSFQPPAQNSGISSPNFSSTGNAWDMPNYGSTPSLQPQTAPTAAPPSNTNLFNGPQFSSPNFPNTNNNQPWDLPNYGSSKAPAPTAPPSQPPSQGQNGGGQQPANVGGQNWNWFGGASPWNTNVTAGTVNPDLSAGPQTSFTQGGWNVNYPTQGAANQLGQMFGANTLVQNMSGNWGPAGAPSAPMYGLDFGIGDPQNAGQVAYWLSRGDNIADIQARLAAGINPPLGPGQASQLDWNFANPTYTTPGAPGNGTVNTGVQPSTHLGPIGGPTTNLQPGAVSGGGTVQVPGGTGTGTTPPPTTGNSPIDWNSWRAFLNSNYFPLSEPGANSGAINQNFNSAMLQNPTLAAFLGIPAQSGIPVPGSAGAEAANSGQDTSINALFRALGLTGSGGQQQMNPFMSSFLQSLLFTPQMYLR